VLCLALLCAGCTGGPGGPEPSALAAPSGPPPAQPAAPAVPGVAAEIVQLRTDEAVGGQVQVRLTNTGDEPFTVTSVALDSPGFEPVAAREVSTEYVAGRVIDLPVRYGEPRCDAAAEPAVARVTLQWGSATAAPVDLPLAASVLGRIHGEECAVRALADVVSVEVTGLEPDGDALTGSLRLTRLSGDDEIRAVRLSRSVLVDVTTELPVMLAPGQGAAEVPIGFTPATCEPHVLAETKKPFVFGFAVEVGEAPEVALDLPLTDATKAELADLVDRVCSAR
jgi:hypothetical protein